jgi:hypothetical protein
MEIEDDDKINNPVERLIVIIIILIIGTRN